MSLQSAIQRQTERAMSGVVCAECGRGFQAGAYGRPPILTLGKRDRNAAQAIVVHRGCLAERNADPEPHVDPWRPELVRGQPPKWLLIQYFARPEPTMKKGIARARAGRSGRAFQRRLLEHLSALGRA